MSMDPESSSTSPRGRGTGRGQSRGRSRGGYGKAMRARGRRGGGRAAEFHQRLTLEGDKPIELDPESEEAKEMAAKYSRRQLGTNADRYREPEPELNSDGEVEVDPEVDLSSFLEKQRLNDDGTGFSPPGRDGADEDDVDRSLARLAPRATGEALPSFKGKMQSIEMDDELEKMLREKEEADANRELKSRFKAKVEVQKTRGTQSTFKQHKSKDTPKEAPPLPVTGPPKAEKEEMEDYLDDLLG